MHFYRLSAWLAVSVAVHAVIIFGVAAEKILLDPSPEETLIAVELKEEEVELAPPKPEPPEPIKEEIAQEPVVPPDSSEPPSPETVTTAKEFQPQLVDRAAFGPLPRPTAPRPIRLPSRRPMRSLHSSELLTVSRPVPRGEIALPTSPGRVKSPPPGVTDRERNVALADRLLASLDSGAATRDKAPETIAGRELEIGGEVGEHRKVVKRPPPPVVDIENRVTVEIEFWVAPSGDVTRAHAIKTGDARLDRAAVDYIKGFKFNALEKDGSGRQRGTIRVRFSLK